MMIGFQNQAPLKSLTTRSSLTMLLRTLYRMGLNYCLLPPTGDYAYVIVFTKEQLVSLIERSSSEMYIAEIPKRVTQGFFKPVAIFKPDASSSDFVSNGGFAESELLQVLVIDEEGAKAVSLKEALVPRVPDFPEWWEAPVPFVMFGYGKVHLNHTAMLMFGPGLKRMPASEVPDKNEFMVMLEGEETPCSVTFHRLEDDIFVLEDSTSDVSAAEEVAWWAAVGKAWAASLDVERKNYRRCGTEEAERLRAEKKLVFPCEWGGELLGYFCVDAENGGGADKTAKRVSKTAASGQAGKDKKGLPSPRSARAAGAKRASPQTGPQRKKKSAEKTEPAENEVLKALGPQAMGLLAPGMTFPAEGEPQGPDVKEINGPESARPRRRPVKSAGKDKPDR